MSCAKIPVRSGLLFAGTERGAFVSFDDGDNWQPLQPGLPDDLRPRHHDPRRRPRDRHPRSRILCARRYRPAARARRQCRQTRRVSSRRRRGPGATSRASPARRCRRTSRSRPIRRSARSSTMSWPRRRRSGRIASRLVRRAGEPVQQRGQVPPLDLSKLPVAPSGCCPPKPPAATPGHHRFVWDLHYAQPAGLTDTDGSGVWAPPGRYTVEVDVGGQQLRQPLVIVPDPRIHVSQARFRRPISSRAAGRAIAGESEQHSQGGFGIEGQAEGQAGGAGACRGDRRADWSAGADPGSAAPETLQGISDRLDELKAAVEGSDGAPSPDALKGYALTSRALEAAAARWNAIAAAAK